MRTRSARVAILAIAALFLAACGGSSDADDSVAVDDKETTTTMEEPTDESGAGDDSSRDEAPDEPDDDEESFGEPSGGIDGSDIDWATVDLTTIDWANLDMRTIDFMAIEENPTAESLDEETIALIQSRLDPGSGTLTIGDTTWEFDSLLCAFGYTATESDVYTFSASGFARIGDINHQLSIDIDDESGEGRFEGEGVVHAVEIDDVTNLAEPTVAWLLIAPDVIAIDGYDITAQGEFRDQVGDADPTPGTFSGTCGTASRDHR